MSAADIGLPAAREACAAATICEARLLTSFFCAVYESLKAVLRACLCATANSDLKALPNRGDSRTASRISSPAMSWFFAKFVTASFNADCAPGNPSFLPFSSTVTLTRFRYVCMSPVSTRSDRASLRRLGLTSMPYCLVTSLSRFASYFFIAGYRCFALAPNGASCTPLSWKN